MKNQKSEATQNAKPSTESDAATIDGAAVKSKVGEEKEELESDDEGLDQEQLKRGELEG